MIENAIILYKNNTAEVYGSLKACCKAKKYSYFYLRKKKFPFIYKGIEFYKAPFNQFNGI